MVIEKQFISAKRFVELADLLEYQDCVVELIEGEIVTMPKPSGGHGEIVIWLASKIAVFVYEHELGRVTGGDAGFILVRNPDGKDTIRGLDIAFISRERTSKPLPFELIDGAPNLAVEVISPNNTASDAALKIRQLLKAGSRLVWVVYPETRVIDAHTADGAITLEENDVLSGAAVLPGFEIRVGDIFPS